MKLSWLNTSEAQTNNTSMYMIWQSKAMHKVKRERESKSQWIKCKNQDLFRGSSTLLYVPAFTQKDFHYIVHTGLPTQGTSTEDLGKYNREYTTPLSITNTTSTLRG